jgi:hypothetical protein
MSFFQYSGPNNNYISREALINSLENSETIKQVFFLYIHAT